MKSSMDPLVLRKMAATAMSGMGEKPVGIAVVEKLPSSSSEVDPEVLKAIAAKNIDGSLTANGKDIPMEWIKKILAAAATDELGVPRASGDGPIS